MSAASKRIGSLVTVDLANSRLNNSRNEPTVFRKQHGAIIK